MGKETGTVAREEEKYTSQEFIRHVHFNLKQNQKNTGFQASQRKYNMHKY